MDTTHVARRMAMTAGFAAIRAEALFLSPLQASQRPEADDVRRAVAVTLRWRGVVGCATGVAEEFGDHPDRAVARMRWALSAVRASYPRR